MNKVQIKRMQKLEEHLRRGKLGHAMFDFSEVNVGPRNPKGCGTMGCAMGELPIIFSRIWIFTDDGRVRLKKDPRAFGIKLIVGNWFGIDGDEAGHLFFPEKQDTKNYGGKDLSGFATREQVAANIRAFLKLKLKGKI